MDDEKIKQGLLMVIQVVDYDIYKSLTDENPEDPELQRQTLAAMVAVFRAATGQ